MMKSLYQGYPYAYTPGAFEAENNKKPSVIDRSKDPT